ncbi:transposase family protein [Caldifermentibacillus hisashii]|uniref:transposase family protein n=1 Tax=Caldifermentibacillus hisashii TaxID=996558 RepID=UPI0031B7E80F
MGIEIKDINKVFHIQEPWFIESCIFDEIREQLDVYVTFHEGSTFTCSNCVAKSQPVYDIADYNRTWRHLNFMEYPCYIHAELIMHLMTKV